MHQLRVILDCMNRFCGCSRKRVKLQKSQIFVSTNVENQLADKLSTFSGILHSDNLGLYLGFPSIHGRVHTDDFKNTPTLGLCKTRENSNFWKNGKIVISVKNQNFSRSRKMKRISPLESSCEIYLPRRISSNFETVGICTFFEAPSIRCRKTTCDVTKITYDMYSCDTSCMSRDMMEMDGRDSAKCQKSKLRDMIGIIGFLK